MNTFIGNLLLRVQCQNPGLAIIYYILLRTPTNLHYALLRHMDIMRKMLTRKSQQYVYYRHIITLLADNTVFFPSNINCR